MLALGFGCGARLLSTIPLLNVVAMPTAVIGEVSLWTERLKKGTLIKRGQRRIGLNRL